MSRELPRAACTLRTPSNPSFGPCLLPCAAFIVQRRRQKYDYRSSMGRPGRDVGPGPWVKAREAFLQAAAWLGGLLATVGLAQRCSLPMCQRLGPSGGLGEALGAIPSIPGICSPFNSGSRKAALLQRSPGVLVGPGAQTAPVHGGGESTLGSCREGACGARCCPEQPGSSASVRGLEAIRRD